MRNLQTVAPAAVGPNKYAARLQDAVYLGEQLVLELLGRDVMQLCAQLSPCPVEEAKLGDRNSRLQSHSYSHGSPR